MQTEYMNLKDASRGVFFYVSLNSDFALIKLEYFL